MKVRSVACSVAWLALLASSPLHAAGPRPVRGTTSLEPRVVLTTTTQTALSLAISGRRATFVQGNAAENPPLLLWNLIDDPAPLSGTVQPYRTSVHMNDAIAAWHTQSLDGLQVTLARLDAPGIEYLASEGLQPDFEDMAIDGECVSFATFDGPPDFTMSVYRACIGANGVMRREIDGNLVRTDNGNPIATHSGVVAAAGRVAWQAGSFAPFFSAPLLWDGERHSLVRLAPTDVFTVAMNRDTLLVGNPIGPVGGTSFLWRYDLRLRRVMPVVSSAWYVQWVSMNDASDVAYNTDHQDGDNQRTYLYRRADGRTLKIGPAGGYGSALSTTVLAYALADSARVYTLADGRDQLLAKGGVYNESLRVSGNAVAWIDHDGFANVSLPAREAIDALAAAVAVSGADGAVVARLTAILASARAAIPRSLGLANKEMGRFVNEVGRAEDAGDLDEARAAAYSAAGQRIRAALFASESGLCANRRDDDGDGAVDCDDVDCHSDGDCMEAFACGDGVDNDHNGAVDCDDGACADQAECTESQRECYDGLDNDDDGGGDCDDSDCHVEPPCNEFGECWDQSDNDGDGAMDCDDPDCSGDGNCREFLCGDGEDNDHDGLTDCDDDECALDFVCQESECDDGVDNDGDGITDCDDDSSCISSPLCHEQTCDNGEDDDHDELKDCEDDDCATQYACFEQGDLECDNGEDDDADGQTDCDEWECALGPACAPDVGEDLGGALGAVASGDLALESDDFLPTCGYADGSLDAEFRWRAPASGTYAFDTFASDFDTMLTVGDRHHLQCSDDEGGAQSRVVATLVSGEDVLVVVHGFGGATGHFVLTIEAQ